MASHGQTKVLLIGSIPVPDAEAAFDWEAKFGPMLSRFPDGEPGARKDFIIWQIPLLCSHPDLAVTPPDPANYVPFPRAYPGPNFNKDTFDLGDIGYARENLKSWELFKKVKEEKGLNGKFQVCFPNALQISSILCSSGHAELEEAYEKKLAEELETILATIPHDQLCIQIDTAGEFMHLEGGGFSKSWFGETYEEVLNAVKERITRFAARVPEDVDFGIHLCYGDNQGKHFVEPKDTSKVVDLSLGLIESIKRPINWLHFPVPMERNDYEYLAPLEKLKPALRPETNLYIGLCHWQDPEGTFKKVEVAKKLFPLFGVSTECGLGRKKPEQLDALFHILSEAAKRAAA